MDSLELLDRAADGFATTLASVPEGGWGTPAGLGAWTVRNLVDHVNGGDRMAAVILAGGSREEGIAAFARSADAVDPVAEFERGRREQADAFGEPGALGRTVAHPAMDMPGSQLLGFRTAEYALHGWDLACALGADDRIDPAVVQSLWDLMSPMASFIGATGMFGDGPSGTVPDDAPLQDRLLDLSGRRP